MKVNLLKLVENFFGGKNCFWDQLVHILSCGIRKSPFSQKIAFSQSGFKDRNFRFEKIDKIH